MASQSITFELKGAVSLQEFDKAVHHWTALVQELSSFIARKKEIRWTIQRLQGGSALATIYGEADDPEDVERVEVAYAQIGRSLESSRPIPFPRQVRSHAQALLRIVDTSETIEFLRLESGEGNIIIFPAKAERGRCLGNGGVGG